MPRISDDNRLHMNDRAWESPAGVRGRSIRFWVVGVVVFGVYGLTIASTGESSSSRGPGLNAASTIVPLWGGRTMLSQVRIDKEPFRDLHHFGQLPCETCHRSSSTSNAENPKTPIAKTDVDIQRSCTLAGCHEWDSSMNHPVGIRPSGPVPAGVVLDAASKITCLSCHVMPAKPSDSAGSGTTRRQLYTPEGLSSCGVCHEKMPGSKGNGSHWRFSARAHLGSRIAAGKSKFESPVQRFSSVDEESRSCLNCHETITAVVPPEGETRQQKLIRFQRMSDHPIGMNYRQKAGEDIRNFKIPIANPDRVRLFEGRVGCGSCHSLYSERPSHLVAEYRNGILCRNCHDR
jgi:hypothetical protein